MKTLDLEKIQQINLFENFTKAHVKELFENNNSYIFIVEQGNMKKALGKQGQNIHRFSAMIRKKVKVVEFNPDGILFLKNLLYPLAPRTIEKQENCLVVTADSKTKALLIGRDRRNLNWYSKVLKDYFKLNIIVK